MDNSRRIAWYRTPCRHRSRSNAESTPISTNYLATGDTGGVRWAVSQAWAADPDRGHDEPWVDLMKAERLDGHRNELRHLVDQLKVARDAEVLEDLAPITYREVQRLLNA